VSNNCILWSSRILDSATQCENSWRMGSAKLASITTSSTTSSFFYKAPGKYCTWCDPNNIKKCTFAIHMHELVFICYEVFWVTLIVIEHNIYTRVIRIVDARIVKLPMRSGWIFRRRSSQWATSSNIRTHQYPGYEHLTVTATAVIGVAMRVTGSTCKVASLSPDGTMLTAHAPIESLLTYCIYDASWGSVE
jgi:hypothetical protein